MGMDLYCLLCGNPSHSLLMSDKEILEDINLYYEIKNSKGKKNYKYLKNMKPFVDKYEENPELFMQNVNKVRKITKWMDKCTLLTIDNKIIHNCKNDDIDFYDSNNKVYIKNSFKSDHNNNYGEYVHTNCWKFIKNTYNIELNYSHLPITYVIGRYYKNIDIDYGKIEKYWRQDFDFVSLIFDSNIDLLYDPLISNQNTRIKKIFNKLKIRLDKNRKSPLTSATFYKPNTYKIGNNNNIWFVHSGKWKEVNDTIEIKIQVNKNNKILRSKYIAEPSEKPIFIKSFINKRNYIELTVITTNSYYENNKKKFN